MQTIRGNFVMILILTYVTNMMQVPNMDSKQRNSGGLYTPKAYQVCIGSMKNFFVFINIFDMYLCIDVQGCTLHHSPFSKVQFFNPDNGNHFDFLIKQLPSTHKLCPDCLLRKIQQTIQAELVHGLCMSNLGQIFYFWDPHEKLNKM